MSCPRQNMISSMPVAGSESTSTLKRDKYKMMEVIKVNKKDVKFFLKNVALQPYTNFGLAKLMEKG